MAKAKTEPQAKFLVWNNTVWIYDPATRYVHGPAHLADPVQRHYINRFEFYEAATAKIFRREDFALRTSDKPGAIPAETVAEPKQVAIEFDKEWRQYIAARRASRTNAMLHGH